MINSKAVKVALVSMLLVGAAVVAANGPAVAAPKAETPATLAYAADLPVNVDVASDDGSIVLSETVITVARVARKAPSAVKACKDAFAFRSVTQGPEGGKVSGFCN